MENKCNGRCEECNVNQRSYCACQMAYYTQQQMAEIKAILITIGTKKEGEIVVLHSEGYTPVMQLGIARPPAQESGE